ncbi:MAG: hypothetical protein RIR70_654 [Pseudomonadota bacterium]|jgi:diguanylate cyclase (GGDEF)-like protein
MAQEAAAGRACILIVDDTPTNIETLVAVLEGEYELAVANSGAQALLLLSRGLKADLILLDVMMPQMDGFDTCQALKQNAATQNIPVIFITARADLESEAKGLAAGAVDFIHKPFGKEVVRARVALHLALRAQQRSLADLNVQLTRTLADVEQANLLLKHLADHDALTQLPNRMLFFDRVEKGLAACQRRRTQLAFLFVDLDDFKAINDKFGHSVGDEVLVQTAKRLNRSVRAADSVGRIGGDEFVVLLQDVQGPAQAIHVAEKIRAAVCEPLRVAGHRVEVAASIGIAIAPEHGRTPIELARHADEAMYAGKAAGRNRVCLFDAPTVQGVARLLASH